MLSPRGVSQTLLNSLTKAAARLEGPATSYWLTREVFLRSLGFIYCVAFLSLSQQLGPLIGQDGILPASLFLDRVQTAAGGSTLEAFWRLPTLFWLNNSDIFLYACCYLGLALSVLLLAGRANAILVALLWVLYLSFVHIGQLFYGYGWESILLETTFLSIFLCPVMSAKPFPARVPPSKTLMWFYRWLIFRVMFGAGLIKMRGDACWADLTCLMYHFETQPIPNPISWYFHQLPTPILKFGVLWNHFMELLVPFFVFGPRRLRIIGGLLLISFQAFLIISGNLSWLNWLTLAICIPCFDDRALRWLIPSRWRKRLPAPEQTQQASTPRRVVIACLAVLLLALSVNPIRNMLSSRQVMNTSFDQFQLLNTYGAFGSIGKRRHEVILQGTTDTSITPSTRWLEYEFHAKPGDVTRRPALIAPYHYRLDWQIWFAAMSTYQQNPWLVHFVYKLLQGDEGALSLLAGNPFPDAPPQFIRAELFAYRFTTFAERQEGWWRRTRIGPYFPPVSLDDRSLRRFLSHYGWSEETQTSR